MKKLFYILLAAGVVFACKEKEEETNNTAKGPQQTVACDASALMGDEFSFSVTLEDQVPLSTLKVELMFDQTVVAETTIRTKENGVYEGKLPVPFLKNIPDGVASAVFTAQNSTFGVTKETKDVAVSRPDFEYLTLVAGETEYRMAKTARNTYATEGVLNGAVDATIVTAPFGTGNKTITFGFSAAQGISPEATGLIPFSGVEANYSATFNTLTWEGSPFVEINLNGTRANMLKADAFVAVLTINKGDQMTLSGAPFTIAQADLDPDYFTTDGKFNAQSGLYKVTILLDKAYLYVERMSSETTYADINSGAIWMIGAGNNYGKPVVFSAGWNTDYGLPFAEVSPNVFQLTLEAGTQLARTNLNVKVFHQKGWGGEFKGSEGLTCNSDLLLIGTGADGNGKDDGNIFLQDGKTLDMGGIYQFKFDLTAGASSPVFTFEKIGQKEIATDEITVNGTKAELVGTNQYAAVLDLTKGANVTVGGVDGLSSYWWDPDFFDGGKFAAVTGKYTVGIDKNAKVIMARRVNADNSAPNLEQGGLYIQGWGVASAVMDGGQVGWPGAGGYQMAQVSDGVYQMTGKAVGEKDATVGGRFRYDYISAKYFFQDGWGGEASKGVTIQGNAAAKLTQGDDGNLGLADQLEEGATYRLTVDFSACTISGSAVTAGKEVVIFDKL